jgi:hypothetical protein
MIPPDNGRDRVDGAHPSRSKESALPGAFPQSMKRGGTSLAAGLVLAILAAWLSGCASQPPDKAAHGPANPEPYLRVANPTPDTVELQIAVRSFMPARRPGPAIWLVGAAHIGESNYFAALQRHLDAQALVLFEGIRSAADKNAPLKIPRKSANESTPPPTAPAATGASPLLQVNMAKSLGLVFQLDAIDYERAHFRNSDLTVEQLQALMSPAPARSLQAPSDRRVPARQEPESADPDNEFSDLLQTMRGTSTFGMIMNALFEFIGYSPRLQALTRLALIETLGQLKGDLAAGPALPPELQRLMQVLIQERNKSVLADLKTELKAASPPRSIAVLYGAAHLPDLEKRLRAELRYRPVDQQWLPVCSVNTRQSGLTDFEIRMVRSFVQSSLQELQAPRTKPTKK